jgi:hypothetical protein
MLKSKQPTLSIEERIEALHREINDLIDKRVEEIRRQTGYSIPPLMIRRDEFERGASECPCRQFWQMRERD